MVGTTVRISDDAKPLLTARPGAFGYSLKRIAGACLLSGLIAAAFTGLTSESAAVDGRAPTFSVDRLNKGDRLWTAPGAQLPRSNPYSTPELRASEPMPAGCEPAFSPFVHPERASIIRDCLT